jgi:hypothetical protein
MKKIQFIIPVLILLVGCKKETPLKEFKEPVLTWELPSDNQIINAGDTLFIRAKITAEDELHGYEVKLKNESNQQLLINQGYHVHGKTISMNEQHILNGNSASSFEIEINVAIDHSGTNRTWKRNISYIP